MTSTQILVLFGMGFSFLIKLICFYFGYLVIKIGAELLREGIGGEFKFDAGLSGLRSNLVSASPGLLFLLIGGVLIGYAMSVPISLEYYSNQAETQLVGNDAPEVELPPDPAGNQGNTQ